MMVKLDSAQKVAGTNTDVVTIVDGNVGVGLVNPTQKLTINWKYTS